MAIRAGTIRIDLIAGTAAFFGDLDRATRKMERKFTRMGRSAERTGRSLFAHLTVPIAALGVATGKVAGDFEKSMNRVQALTRATGAEFNQMRSLAEELGATTQFSAAQAADGMGFLAQAGFETTEIIGAMPTVLNLAAAAQIDLARSADLASNIMSGFGLSVDQLSDATDVLTLTFASSNTNLEQLAEAFKIAGPVASAAGISFTETAALIGKMGDAGFQASLAGTALRGAIAKLLLPSAEAAKVLDRLNVEVLDSQGNMRSLVDIIDDLRNSGATAGDVLEIFGQRAGPAMQALVLQGADAIRELEAELQNAGGATDQLASVQMRGLIGATREMISAFQGALIELGDAGVLGAFTLLMRQITRLLRWFGDLNDSTKLIVAGIAAVVAGIGPLLITIGVLLPLLGKGTALLTGFAVALTTSAVGASGLAAALGGLIGFMTSELFRATEFGSKAINGLAFAMNAAVLKYQQLTGEISDREFLRQMIELGKIMEDAENAIESGARFDVAGNLEEARNKAEQFLPSLGRVFDLFGSLQSVLQNVVESSGEFDDDMEDALTKIGDLTPAARKALDELRAELRGAQRDLEETGEKTEVTFGRIMTDAIEAWSRQASQAVAAFAVRGELSLSKLRDALLETLIGFFVQQAIFAPLLAGLGSAFGSFFPLAFTGSKGFAFSGGARFLKKGGIMTSPTMFMSGEGLNVAAEADTEAVMPVGRDSHGRLGVLTAGGGGGTVVQVIDQRGQGEPVGVSRERKPDGREVIRVMVRDAVKSELAAGGLDRPLGESFGVRRQPTRR